MTTEQQPIESPSNGGRDHRATRLPNPSPDMHPPDPVVADSEDTAGKRNGRAARSIERVRALAHDHPWMAFGAAIGVGAAIAAGTRYIPDGSMSRMTRRVRQSNAASGVAAMLGAALLRMAVTAGIRKFEERRGG
jgi:hypothetical protein